MIEVNIVWKYPPEQFGYLRESSYWTMRSKGPIHGWSGRNGYAKTLEELQKVADMRSEMKSRGGNMKWAPDVHLIVGYAEVANTHSRVGYERRYWWVRTYDRDVYQDGVYAKGHPCEAVDPLSIAINCQSERVSNESRLRGAENLITQAVEHYYGKEALADVQNEESSVTVMFGKGLRTS